MVKVSSNRSGLISVVACATLALATVGTADARQLSKQARGKAVTGIDSVVLVETGAVHYGDRVHFKTTLAVAPRRRDVLYVRVDCGQWGATGSGWYWTYAQKSADLASAKNTGLLLTREASNPALIWVHALKADWDPARPASCSAVLEKVVTTRKGSTTYALARTNFDVAGS